MILLSGADVVLPDKILSPGTIALEDDRIAEIVSGSHRGDSAVRVDLTGRVVVPGFIDVHVHGLEGSDTLDGPEAIGVIAERMPRFGVTSFCPTSIACSPSALRMMLTAVRMARASPVPGCARVLPAHLESNFINPEFRGAQPLDCLRLPRGASPGGEFAGDEILQEIARARGDVGIVTVAPELEGALDLIGSLAAAGHRVSLGHSGATYEQGIAGIAAGARHATHLFNRMTPIGQRAPGLAAAVLEHDDVAAEIICDGVHVHPAMVRIALAAKRSSRLMAITDGTAGAGLPEGARAMIGGRRITVGDAARLDDGTLAGSVLTMDRVFARLAGTMGIPLVEAAQMCATTPARSLNLEGLGAITRGARADLTVLDRQFSVVQTYVSGGQVWPGKGKKDKE
ncbi:MAG: N-acetylglucosamine-6-phosphate deacetylase [Acidobacteria bacterium]|nr:N-acetylglucosamine-6-phosphate deacetylase [Acidobacteriota bacterium]MCA1650694.1 N-acetylglucosamine-6-phosphate deacetylase [Acidobacteriota bacterium]